MLSSDMIPLVAEAINTRPRKLGLAGKKEQALIKGFRYHLGWKLKTAVQITFAVWDSTRETLIVGYMPLEFREAAECTNAAASTITELKEKTKIEMNIEATLAGIPNNGLFLLYEFSQAYEIATNLRIMDFSTIQFAYTACLHFAAADRRDVDAEKWFEILCEFSNKCISNGAWRTALLCLDQAETLFGYFFSKFDAKSQHIEELVSPMIHLGEAFQFVDLPERSIDLAKKYMPRLEQQFGHDPNCHEELQKLDMEILSWHESSNEIWAENAPLIVIGKDFAKKIS